MVPPGSTTSPIAFGTSSCMMPLIGARTSSLPTRSFSLLMGCPTFGQLRRDLRALLRQRLLVLRIELRLHGLNAVQRFNNEIVTPIIVARSRVKHMLQRLSADQCRQPEDGQDRLEREPYCDTASFTIGHGIDSLEGIADIDHIILSGITGQTSDFLIEDAATFNRRTHPLHGHDQRRWCAADEYRRCRQDHD